MEVSSENARVTITTDAVELEGLLGVPDGSKGVVLFAHGSGSGRLSPRNNYVARALREDGIGTLLFDLLTEREADDRRNVFDIDLLAQRLHDATLWVRGHAATKDLAVGYFGASTGAAAALLAAADDPRIRAIVSRGGRPDLAARALTRVRAPTRLIVGGEDDVVIRLNEEAYGQLRCEKDMHIVPGATHLFEEPGTLDQVVQLAIDWFRRHCAPRSEPIIKRS
jgi:putative phosphoribosyl transferase